MQGKLVLLPGLRIKEGLKREGFEGCLLFNPKTDFVFKATPSVVKLLQMFKQPREPEEALAAFLAESEFGEPEVRGILKELTDEEILVPAGPEQ